MGTVETPLGHASCLLPSSLFFKFNNTQQLALARMLNLRQVHSQRQSLTAFWGRTQLRHKPTRIVDSGEPAEAPAGMLDRTGEDINGTCRSVPMGEGYLPT